MHTALHCITHSLVHTALHNTLLSAHYATLYNTLLSAHYATLYNTLTSAHYATLLYYNTTEADGYTRPHPYSLVLRPWLTLDLTVTP